MARARPYFRTSLWAFAGSWNGGPGLLCPIAQFGLHGGFPTDVTGQQEGAPRTVQLALVTPEVPYSVLPFSLREGAHIVCDHTVPNAWQGSPVPRWRGVACQIGTTQLFLPNHARGGEPVPFSLQVLLPDSDPAGPRPECAFLGEQFLTHYDLRLTLDYSAIRYVPSTLPGRKQFDSTVRCGSLRMD